MLCKRKLKTGLERILHVPVILKNVAIRGEGNYTEFYVRSRNRGNQRLAWVSENLAGTAYISESSHRRVVNKLILAYANTDLHTRNLLENKYEAS